MRMQPSPVQPATPVHTTDPFEVYSLFVRDTARLSDRRQSLNAIYISVNSVVLGAVALLAQLGGITSPVFLAAEVFVAVAGILITGQWMKMINKYQALLRFRFLTLIEMEALLGVDEKLKLYTREAGENLFGFSELELQLPRIFRWLYGLGSILLVGISVANKLGLLDALRLLLVHLLQQWGVLPK